MKCPGCGGKAVFEPGAAVGWFKHRPGCRYDIEARMKAARLERELLTSDPTIALALRDRRKGNDIAPDSKGR